jgi:hypothetical protein
VLRGKRGRLARSTRECCQELVDHVGLEREVRRGLPEDRAERGTEAEQAGGEEVGEHGVGVAQSLHMRDEPAALD